MKLAAALKVYLRETRSEGLSVRVEDSVGVWSGAAVDLCLTPQVVQRRPSVPRRLRDESVEHRCDDGRHELVPRRVRVASIPRCTPARRCPPRPAAHPHRSPLAHPATSDPVTAAALASRLNVPSSSALARDSPTKCISVATTVVYPSALAAFSAAMTTPQVSVPDWKPPWMSLVPMST